MEDLLLLSTICFVAMVSPGPDFLLVTRNSLIYPRLQALATSLGIIVGCLVHATYCTLGLAIVITKSVLAFSIIKYAGACYLIYLGLRGLTSKARSCDEVFVFSRQEISVRSAFVQGFLCNLLNPKAALFLLSLFTQFITVDASITEKLTVAAVFVVESAIYWPLLVLFFQRDIVRTLFSKLEYYLDKIFGGLLVMIGLKVAVARD